MSEHLHAQDAAPPWAQTMMADLKSLRSELAALAVVVKGGGDNPSHAEQLRDHARRLSSLENVIKWVTGLGTTFIAAVGSAWALMFGGPSHK